MKTLINGAHKDLSLEELQALEREAARLRSEEFNHLVDLGAGRIRSFFVGLRRLISLARAASEASLLRRR